MKSEVCRSVAEAADRAYAYVIVTTKAIPDVMPTPELLAPFLEPAYVEKYEQPVYVLLQNGLNVEMDLFAALKALGKAPQILGSALYINANALKPDLVEHSDFGWISLGVYREDHSVLVNSPEDEALLKGFAELVNAGGGIARTWPAIQRVRFTKNLWNLTFSSFCTLTGYPVPALFRPPPKAGDTYEVYVSDSTRNRILENTLPTIKAMMEEYVTLGENFDIIIVATTLTVFILSSAYAMDLSEPGTGVTSAFVDYMIKETAAIHGGASSTHLPSMLLDAQCGRPMELEVIVGEVVRMAKGAGVAVPRIEMISQLAVVSPNQALMSTTDAALEVLVIGLGAVGSISKGFHIKSKKYGDIPGWKPYRHRAYSHVVVTTKAVPDVLRTSDLLKALLTAPYVDKYEQPTYILLQNGLNVEEDLYKAVKALGKEEPKVVGSGVYINANLVDTNVVEHSDFGWLSLGLYREEYTVDTQNSPVEEAVLKTFADLVNEGQGTAKIFPLIQRVKFSKNLWNLTFASFCTLVRQPLPALYRAPPKDDEKYDVYVSDSTRQYIENFTMPAIKSLMLEYVALASALGFDDPKTGITPPFVDHVLKETAAIHAKADSVHRPSMMLDAENGNPMEVEVIVGEVVRMARDKAVDVPEIAAHREHVAVEVIEEGVGVGVTEEGVEAGSLEVVVEVESSEDVVAMGGSGDAEAESIGDAVEIAAEVGTEAVMEATAAVAVLTAAGAEGEEASLPGNKAGQSSFVYLEATANIRISVFNPPGAPPPVIDARLQNTAQNDLIQSFKSLTIHAGDLPNRPDFGTAGTQVTLRTNFFPVKVPKGPLSEYDVGIMPKAGTAIKRMKRRIWQLAEQTADWQAAGMKGWVAHDHSAKLIAGKKLPQPLVIRVPFYEEEQDGPKKDGTGKEYILTIKYIQDIETLSLVSYLSGDPQFKNYDTLPVTAALNLILAAFPNRATQGGGVLVGRNRFFFPSTTSPPVPLGGGLEAWKGFYSSIRPAFNQLMVNVNVCTTAFYSPGNLADALTSFRRMSFGGKPNAFVKGLRVSATHLGYRKTIKTMSTKTSKTHSFDCPELGGGKVTVEQYFSRKYSIKLQYPELPLVDVGGGNGKTNLLPAEVLEILPGQAFKGKLTDEHTASMITAACKPPNVNGMSIVTRGLDELGFRSGPQPLGNFGISIGTDMSVVPGRILPPPGIKYGSGQPQVDERASWNLRNVKFAQGGRLAGWAVLIIQDGNQRDEFQGADDPELKKVVAGFSKMCSTSGMQVDRAEPMFAACRLPPKDYNDPIRAKAVQAIRATLTTMQAKPTVILVILSNGDKHVYSGIKHLCDSYLDVATVCVHSSKIRKEKGQMQYFANVALKMNMKMGGTNHCLDPRSMSWLQQAPTMLVGMDVTHPGPGSIKGTPSIAAVVASTDSQYGQFPASMEIQESKKEMITNLAQMMKERLTAYRNKNRTLPTRVIVYRDGVSEGQFQIVVGEELPLIKEAFHSFNTPQQTYNPKLTIVICGKRHHTRFYPTEASAADRDGNPRPGTVVDRGVTAVYDFDFFLQAHGGLQGTTRPTHYYVVHDEIGFKADALQGLTNAVSYMFARATKAVSLASPAYYADLCCERGRCYLHALLQGASQGNTTTASNEEAIMQQAAAMWHNGVGGRNLKETMYYL
ncbi:hypothetical protein HWV62_32204 [Athelia sp. TMB]|nr:hypothetical protein HWV62_32204 [Athelia sp. TMB]